MGTTTSLPGCVRSVLRPEETIGATGAATAKLARELAPDVLVIWTWPPMVRFLNEAMNTFADATPGTLSAVVASCALSSASDGGCPNISGQPGNADRGVRAVFAEVGLDGRRGVLRQRVRVRRHGDVAARVENQVPCTGIEEQ